MSEQEHVRGCIEPTRPDMPGYGFHSGGEGMLPWGHVSERMSAARNYWVGTTRTAARDARVGRAGGRNVLLRHGGELAKGA